MGSKRSLLYATCLLGSLLTQARAEPALQLYVQGADYDKQSDTWVINTKADSPINLWVLAYPPKDATIKDVSIIIAGSRHDGLQSTIVGSNLGADGFILPDGKKPFHDSFYSGNAPAATLTLSGTGTTPPTQKPHGIYGDETSWWQYSLGNFVGGSLVKIADMVDAKNPSKNLGYLGVYQISFTASELPTWVNIDGAITYTTTDKKGKVKETTKFAPYSHTARGTVTKPPVVITEAVPEPSSLAIACVGALGLAAYGVRRRRAR